jgi:hypothetical protein
VAPLLRAPLQAVLGRLCGAFPAAKACLLAATECGGGGGGAASSGTSSGLGAAAGNAAALAAITDEFDADEAELGGGHAGGVPAPEQAPITVCLSPALPPDTAIPLRSCLCLRSFPVHLRHAILCGMVT